MESPIQGSARHLVLGALAKKRGKRATPNPSRLAFGDRKSAIVVLSCGAGGVMKLEDGSDGPYFVRTVSVTIGVQL